MHRQRRGGRSWRAVWRRAPRTTGTTSRPLLWWRDPLHAIALVRTLFIRGWQVLRAALRALRRLRRRLGTESARFGTHEKTWQLGTGRWATCYEPPCVCARAYAATPRMARTRSPPNSAGSWSAATMPSPFRRPSVPRRHSVRCTTTAPLRRSQLCWKGWTRASSPSGKAKRKGLTVDVTKGARSMWVE